MGKPHLPELPERVVWFVDEGHCNRSAAARFRVSPRFVNDILILRCETGCLHPEPQSQAGRVGKLRDQHEWIRHRIAEDGELTLDALVLEPADCGVKVHRSSVGSLPGHLGLSHQKHFSENRPHEVLMQPVRSSGKSVTRIHQPNSKTTAKQPVTSAINQDTL